MLRKIPQRGDFLPIWASSRSIAQATLSSRSPTGWMVKLGWSRGKSLRARASAPPPVNKVAITKQRRTQLLIGVFEDGQTRLTLIHSSIKGMKIHTEFIDYIAKHTCHLKSNDRSLTYKKSGKEFFPEDFGYCLLRSP